MRYALLVLALLWLMPATAMAKGETEDGACAAPVDVGLDPGHSSFDVGAVGGGLSEYEVTFAIALRVRDLLEAEGLTVAMSREDDLPLTDFSAEAYTDAVRQEQERRIAAVGNARLYISIHLNGYSDPRVRGLEVYFNGDNHGEESSALAASIHRRLLETLSDAGYEVPDRGVKEDLAAGKPYGHFFSLRGPMPSVLVESMFLTNPTEAALLAEESTQEAIALGIAEGIVEYLEAESGL